MGPECLRLLHGKGRHSPQFVIASCLKLERSVQSLCLWVDELPIKLNTQRNLMETCRVRCAHQNSES